jgi:nucleoid-associated protein YgaU
MKTTLRNCLLLVSIGGLPFNPLFAQAPASLDAEARPPDARPVLEAEAEVVDELTEGKAISSVETVRSVEDDAASAGAPAGDVATPDPTGEAANTASTAAESGPAVSDRERTSGAVYLSAEDQPASVILATDDVAIPEAPSDAMIPASGMAEESLAESPIDPTGRDPYLDALGAEARAEDRPAPAAQRREQASDGRVNAIRSIVADALEKPREQPEPVKTLISPDSSAPAARSRRDELRSAVSRAARETGSSADLYISTLKQEGDRTRVIDEEASRRPAVAEQVPVPELALEPDETAGDGRTYRVRAGDSFWKIAERLYGDGYKFLELYEANKDQVTDENLLVVGQVLRIPPLDESAIPHAFGN